VQDTRTRILSAAIREICQHGWKVPIEAIAKAAKVDPITVYRHFTDREALLREVMHEASRRNPLIAYLKATLRSKPVPPLHQVMCGMTEVITGSSADLYRLIYHASLNRPDVLAYWDADPDRPHVLTLLAEYVNRLRAQKMLSAALGPDESAAKQLHGMIMGSFDRNVLFEGCENADADPVNAMRHLCLAIEHIP